MNLLVPKFSRALSRAQERELRTGDRLAEAFRLEKAQTHSRMLAAALPYRKAVPHSRGSEFELKAVIDPRTYMRWFLTDPHFWDDPANVKRFIRDNPVCQPWKT